jgi:long-chain acyl-CoA synthetase
MNNTSKLIVDTVRMKGDHVAFSLDNEDVTFSDLFLMARATSEYVHNESVEHVGIYCHSLKKFIISFYSCLLSGTPAFLISTSITEHEMESLCAQFKVTTLLTDTNSSKLSENIKCIEPVSEVSLSQDIDFREYANIDGSNVAFYLMTSGTTGKKRAVPVTHRNLLWTGKIFNEFMGITENQKEMVLIPLTHSFGARRIIAQLLLGGTIYSLNGIFNPAAALMCIKQNNCSVLSLVPSQVRMFQQYFKNDFNEIGNKIKFIELSSEYMAPHEKKELVKSAPNAQIVMGYGLTEATRSTLLHFKKNADKIHTSGKPISGIEVFILDKNDSTVFDGGEGQIAIKGSNVVDSYYGSNIEGNENFRNGCFYTGDTGFMDEDGFLSVTGRMDDIINVGGKKFNPIELELDLREKFPSVDCAISHIPDKVLGSRPVLCIKGEDNGSTDILDYISINFESFKHPSTVVYMNEIFRTENGKIIRSMLNNKVLEKVRGI